MSQPSTPAGDRRAGAERLFALSPDPLAVAGFDGYLKQVNPAWEQLLGWTREELAGRPYAEFVHPDDRERTLAEAARLTEPGAVTRDFELRIAVKGGGFRWLRLSAQGSADEQAIYVAGKDVTERKAAQEALERSNAELEQFAYVASHDLSEPLRMVSGFVQLLAERYRGRLDADADEFIAYTVDGVERMQGLIDDLLAYSRVGRSRRMQDVDLERVLEGARASLAATLAERDAHIEAGPLPVVRGDARELGQVMQNLLSNAVKFVEDGPPRVSVSAHREDETWTISVRDNGIGVEPRHAERIFKMFQRLHTRERYPGSGVGLAICKKILEGHGGTIAVTPAPGGGSVFSFTLPADGGPEAGA